LVDRWFHYLSFLSPILIVWGMWVCFTGVRGEPDRLIETISYGLIIAGLGMGMSSFTDLDRLDGMDRSVYGRRRLGRVLLLGPALVNVAVIIFAFYLLISGVKDLGLGILSLGLGAMGVSKLEYDKYKRCQADQVIHQRQSNGCKVTGLGGIFFKADDRGQLLAWYRDHLGLDVSEWGSVFHWRESEATTHRGYTVWCPFDQDADKFDPSIKPFMMNYRVGDLTALMAGLQDAGVEIVGEIEDHENGRFAWILDPEGNKIELWEPVEHSRDPYL